MILTKITNLAKIRHFIRSTSCKFIPQIFANPLALYFQIRHFRHCSAYISGHRVYYAQCSDNRAALNYAGIMYLTLKPALFCTQHNSSLTTLPFLLLHISAISLLLKFYNFLFYMLHNELRCCSYTPLISVAIISTLANAITFFTCNFKNVWKIYNKK